MGDRDDLTGVVVSRGREIPLAGGGEGVGGGARSLAEESEAGSCHWSRH